MKSLKIVRVFVVSLALLSCSETVGPPSSIAEAKALWQHRAIPTYSYSASMACFCPGPSVPVRVDVADGNVVNVTDLGTHSSIATTGWYTIDELFDFAERTQAEVLEFDP